MSAEKSDWLDLALKNHPVADEGFYDRVIAVGRAQRRNRWLLRSLVVVLGVGLVVAFAGVVVVQAWKGSGFAEHEPYQRWLDHERAAFTSEMRRLDAVPALARRSGKDAAPLLDAIERELQTKGSARAACVADLDAVAGTATADDVRAIDDRCDTSFFVGLADHDEWRWVREVALDVRNVDRDFAVLARSHLREARRAGGAAYAAAGNDVAALGRLAWGHSWWATAIWKALIEETDAATAAGEHGGYVAPLTDRDVNIASSLWMAGAGFAGVGATAEDFATVDGSRSVLSCGARSDAFWELAVQERFFDDARSARLSSDGCSPRVANLGTWRLFDDQRTRWARFRGALLELPPLRYVGAHLVWPTTVKPEIAKKVRRDTVE